MEFETMAISREIYEAAKLMNDADSAEFMGAVMAYGFDGIEPDFKNETLRPVWVLAKSFLNGGIPKTKKATKAKKEEENIMINFNEVQKQADEEMGEPVNEFVDFGGEVKPETKKKETKHIHGEYKNVTLTDAELEKLNEEYGNDTILKSIEYLSAYKKEKPYKTKSDYLTIRRWVVDAVNRDFNNKGGNFDKMTQKEIDDLWGGAL